MRKLLYIVLGIIALFFMVALIAPKDYVVTRSVEINQPKEVVFIYIKMLKNQDEFATWVQKDPNTQKSYRGIDGTVGFVSRWESDHEEVGVGEQEILKIQEGERIDYELRFETPWEAVSPAWLSTESINPQTTKVEWGFAGHMPIPMNIMLLFMDMDETLGKDLQQGLNNLKDVLE